VRPSVLAPLIALLLAAPGAARAQDRDESTPDYGPWVTVNICDTPGAPNEMGVRASIPGNGKRQRMYVRFTAQYYSRARKRWRRVRGNGRSPWIYAGSARFRARQAGWTFRFRQPKDGATFLVRAYGHFEWRKRKRRRGKRARWVVAKRKRRTARSGIVGVDAGDPPGTSLGSCYIR
jgi:hypothetical protein